MADFLPDTNDTATNDTATNDTALSLITDGTMRRTVFLRGYLLLRPALLLAAIALLLGPFVPGSSAAADWSPIRPPESAGTTTITIPAARAEIDARLQQGQQLEVERRWGEALTHYEDAIRRYPENADLQQRYDSARLHYDVVRRYGDRSFHESLTNFSSGDTLDLYARILLKIQAHYVDVPDWQVLVDRGRESLEVALGEPSFLDHHIPPSKRADIESFIDELRRTLSPRAIATRKAAADAVADAATLANRRLQISEVSVILEFLCGATSALDPYSSYLTPDQLAEVHAQIDGNFVGLGIELKAEDGELLIVRVIPGSPAKQGGILANDRIVSVDGHATADYSTDEAANLLQGKEGSVANLVLVTPGKPPRHLSVQRRRVEVPSIDDAKIIDSQSGVGYLKLLSFQKTTCRDLDEALWKLHRQGMKSLIIDVRGNPGGLLITGVEVSDKFLDRGVIVSTRGRSLQEDFTYTAHSGGTWHVPLVVLIDGDSASAAEIFAGAIREHRRGTVVGDRSYGKGTVQGIFELAPRHGGIRLTTAKFYSPSGRPYSRVGVQPDMVVHEAAKPIPGQTPPTNIDAVMTAAVQAARDTTRPR